MKKVYSTVITFLFLCSNIVQADVYNGKCSDSMVKWTLDSSTGTLTFSGIGKMGYWTIDHDVHYHRTNQRHEDITKIVIEEGITSIKFSEYLPNLRSITLPKSLKKIPFYTFSNWTANLVDVYITDLPAWNNIEHEGSGSYIPAYNLYCNFQKVTNIDQLLWYKVKKIKPYAFAGCKSLTAIKISEDVQSIGDHAFEGCNNVKSIVWGAKMCNTSQPFKDICEQITSFELYPTAEILPLYLCKDMVNLSSINIPNSIKEIYSGAFENCSGLKKVVINSLEKWCQIVFASESSNPLYYAHYLYLKDAQISKLVIPSTITLINSYAFAYNYGITEVSIPASVTVIGSNAFYDCYRVKTIQIPTSVKEIGDGAFGNVPNIICELNAYDTGERCNNGYIENSLVYNNKNKTYLCACFSDATGDIILPNTVERIEENAFYWCTGITSITLPPKVKHIGYGAFQGCTNMTRINNLPEINELNSYLFYYCKKIQSIEIPNTITSIGDNTFRHCESITSLIIPNGVKTIGSYAFAACYNLSSINLPISVTRINNNAFAACQKLQSITLPPNLTSISNAMFYNCTALQSITIPSNVASIGSSAFERCSTLSTLIFENALPKLKIFANAFDNCVSLKTFTIYDGIQIPKEIEDNIKVLRVPYEKPNIYVVPNSLIFQDTNENGYMDVDEPCKILFTLRNIGPGEARNCKISISTANSMKNIHFATTEPFNIHAQGEKQIEIPISSDTTTLDGKVEMVMKIAETQGQLIKPLSITIPLKHFEHPAVKLTRFELYSYGNIAQKKRQLMAKLYIANSGNGFARNVRYTIHLPQGMSLIEGEVEKVIPVLSPNEEKEVVLELMPGLNIADSVSITVFTKEKYGKFSQKGVVPITFGKTPTYRITSSEDKSLSIAGNPQIKMLPNTSVAILCPEWFNKYNNPQNVKSPFPYATIKLELKGTKEAIDIAKERLSLTMGGKHIGEAKDSKENNMIWFLVHCRNEYIDMDCGDGCEAINILKERLEPNKVYKGCISISVQ